MTEKSTHSDTETDSDDGEQTLRQRAKAYMLAAYAYVSSALADARDEIAPQLRGLSLPHVPERAVKPLALAAVLVLAAVAMPAAPFASDAGPQQDPVEGETFEPVDDGPSLNGVSLNELPSTYLGTGDDAPDPPKQVRASAGSQTMQVETTVVDGEPAIVLEDDRTHDGRWVSIETSWFEEHVGEVPNSAYVQHESGDEYASPIQTRGGQAAFYVREFSENTISFDGEISVNATPATNGDSFQYEQPSDTTVDNVSLEVTGFTNEKYNNQTYPDLSNGASRSVSVGGNTNATAELTLTGASSLNDLWTENFATNVTDVTYYDDGSVTEIYVVDANGNLTKLYENGNVDWTMDVQSSAITSVTVDSGRAVYTVGEGETLKKIPYEGQIDYSKSIGSTGNGVAVDSNHAYAATENGAVYRFDKSGGDGTYHLAVEGFNTYTALGNNPTGSVYAGGPDNNIIKADSSMSRVWKKSASGPTSSKVNDIEVSGGNVYLAYDEISYSYPSLVAFDESGNQLWSSSRNGELGNMRDLSIGPNGNVYAGSSNGKLYKYTSSGSKVWSFSAHSNSIEGVAAGNYGSIYTGSKDNTVKKIEQPLENPSLSVDGTEEIAVNGQLSDGASNSTTVSLDPGDHTVSMSADSGSAAVDVDVTERTQTADPTIQVASGDGTQNASINGVLADGETADISTQLDPAMIDGDTTVSVTTSESVTSPVGKVSFNLSHDAELLKTVDYQGEAFSERYSFSKTWNRSSQNATVTIPWASDSIISVKSVELTHEYSDGSTSTKSPSYQTVDGELVVEVGGVESGETTSITAVGSKIRAENATITVTDPSNVSEPLNSRIRFDSVGQEPAIYVGGTDRGDELHYAENASYGDAETTVTYRQDGTQRVEFANAVSGGKTTLKTWPIAISIRDRSVRIPERAGTESQPGVVVRGDGTRTVDYTYTDAQDATPYVLYSESDDIVRDQGLASSPITLTDDNSDETLVFRVDDGTASESSSGSDASLGGGAGPMDAAGGGFNLNFDADLTTPLTIIVSLIAIVGVLFVSRRLELIDTTDRGDTVVGTARSTAQTLLGNEIVVGGAVLALGAYVATSTTLPSDTKLILALASVPVATFLGLRQFGEFDFRIWVGSTALVGVFGLQQLAPELFTTIADEAGIIIVVGAIALGWRFVSALRADANTPDEQTTVTLELDDDGGDD